MLHTRTRDAIAATRAAGIHVILVTGRMFQAVRGYAREAGIDDPVVCYQGAVVAEHLGFSRERTVAFGDGENDLELVDWAGFGVAVDNAHDLVKEHADFVCPSVDEEGVAQVLEAYLDSRA